MANSIGIKILASAAIVAAALMFLPAGPTGSNAMEPTVTETKTPVAPLVAAPARALPAIDLAAPKKVETATFALG
jgi:hypothetical protein